MSETIVAKRYADALFQLAIQKSELDQYEESLRAVREVFKDNKQLNSFLLHPRVNGEQKEKLITESLKGLHKDVVNTIKLLVQRHRTMLIPSIVEAFIKNVNDAKGIEVATVYSVRELSAEEKQGLRVNFAKRIGKNTLEFENVIDPSLIGGIKIRVGNTIYDGSISGKLHRLEQKITVANK
ncbi:F0F1 ATP synthase subunit delta [Oceanobacillus luteolus]|uniref:ATP synthase subunit delta n=1 Tax=Oceanobacillus luteolus TaxID=1274358 RepID=A0ABW4HLD7_9BACI|nr:F0F1 ATP synthase subunit delta [Oceanobacillus luteolus]MCM3741655.1 F0F1 ATP synthase subunit delta [Oceanobacillus luteolus]